jgi:uncharacterized protein (TIRG00374 family)
LLRQIGRIVRPLFALALTYYVLRRADPAAVLDAAAGADLRWFAPAIALVVVDRLLMAYRWIALLCTVEPGRRPPLTALFRVFFVSTFVGTFLPASVGGDVARALSLSRLNVASGAAVASVLVDRVLGVISILVVGVLGLLVSRSEDLLSMRGIEISLTMAGMLSLVAGLLVFSERAATIAQHAAGRLPMPAVRSLGADLVRATRAYAAHHGVLVSVLFGSIAVQLLRIAQAYYLGRALHITAPFAVYVALVPLILLVMLLPVSINGIGPSQAAFVWFFGRAGVASSDAFALSVLFVALGIIGNLPGGILYAAGPPGHEKPGQYRLRNQG